MDFSVIIPCYDEKLPNVLACIKQIEERFKPAEFLVMENGSLKLGELARYGDHVQYHQNNTRALGWALRQGLKNATQDKAVFLPADLAYDLSFVNDALPLLDAYPMVIGSKALMGSNVGRPLIRRMISNLYNSSLWLIYDHYHHPWPLDITGAKGYDLRRIRRYLDSCPSDGLWFEVELVREILKDDGIVREIPVKVSDFRAFHFR